jgi:hypothetical protein
MLIFALIGGAIWFVSEASVEPPPGEVVVAQRFSGGHDVVVDGGYVWPWINAWQRMDVDRQTTELELEDVSTRDGTSFDLDLHAVTNVETFDDEALERAVSLFLGEGPEHVETVVGDSVESIVRSIVGSKPASDVFETNLDPEESDPREVLQDDLGPEFGDVAASTLRDTYGLRLEQLTLSHIELSRYATWSETETRAETDTEEEAGDATSPSDEPERMSNTPSPTPETSANPSDETERAVASETATREPGKSSDDSLADEAASGSETSTGPPDIPTEVRDDEHERGSSTAPDSSNSTSKDEPGLDGDDLAEAALDGIEDEELFGDPPEEGSSGAEAIEPTEFEDDEKGDARPEKKPRVEANESPDLAGDVAVGEGDESSPEMELDAVDDEFGSIDESAFEMELDASLQMDDELELDDQLGDDGELAAYDPGIEMSSSSMLDGDDEALAPYDPGIDDGSTAASDSQEGTSLGDDALAPYDPAIDDDIVDESIEPEGGGSEPNEPPSDRDEST